MSSTTKHQRGLRALTMALGAALALSTLAACAPPRSAQAADGGTLTIGLQGSSSETVDPHVPVSAMAAEERYSQLYDGLTKFDPKGDVVWDLATDMKPNKDSTEWTVTLHEGVKTHQGKDFGADDVIYSIKRILDPKRNAMGASLIKDIVDPAKITKVDDHTLKFKLKKAYGPFKDLWAIGYLKMVPQDFDAKDPDGTGPFSYTSATPGQESTFTRFDDYFGGAAKIQTLKIQDFQSIDAIVNALRGGQIDVAGMVPFSQADSIGKTAGLKVLTSESNNHLIIYFRTDLAPFDDVRVRQAVKLAVDRDQVVENAFSGHGAPANDMSFRGTENCPVPKDAPQRTQDIAQAKKLLADAGQSDLKFSIATANDQPGMLELAQVVQQNAKAAGIDVKIDQMDTAGYLAKWGEWPVGMDYDASPYLTAVSNSLLPSSDNNPAHWDDKEFVKLSDELFTTSDPEQQCSIMNKMQTIEWERGGLLIPAWTDVLTAHSDKVTGLQPDVNGTPLHFLTDVAVGR